MKNQPRTQFTIDVFPHVRKFMLNTFAHKGDVFYTTEGNELGKFVALALCDKRKWKFLNSQTRNRPTVKITLQLTTDQLQLGPRLSKLQRLNLDMEDLFQSHLLVWINAHGHLDVAARAACLSFLEHHKIIEGNEYKLDTAYKLWQRAKTGLQ